MPAADAGLVEALEHARLFIVNGIDIGFIQMPVAGSQLFTKNGRRMGNAHIVEVRPLDSPGQAGFVYEYVCISDAGNEFTLSHGSLFELFEIGDYISDVARIKKHFLRS